MGRSRGGLISKVHALVEAEGRPISLRLSAGQVADCKEAETLIELLSEGDILLADKGYDTDAIRAKAAERKAWANIPPKANRKGAFSFSVYRQRNLIERSSIASNISAASQPAMTRTRKTTSPPSNSLRRGSGACHNESTP